MAASNDNLQKYLLPARSAANVVGVVVSLLLFVALVGILFWFTRQNQTAFSGEAKTPDQKLRELRAQDRAALSEYGWVDRPKGVVRIPIDRAMGLLIQEMSTRNDPKGE